MTYSKKALILFLIFISLSLRIEANDEPILKLAEQERMGAVDEYMISLGSHPIHIKHFEWEWGSARTVEPLKAAPIDTAHQGRSDINVPDTFSSALEPIDTLSPETTITEVPSAYPEVSATWYRLTLINTLHIQKDWVITTALTQAPLLKVYAVSDNQSILLLDINSQSSFADRHNHYRVLTIPLSFNAKETKVIYFQYRGIASNPIFPKVTTPETLEKRNSLFEFANGVVFGTVIVFFLFFFMQFLARPSKVMGVYCMLVLSVGFLIAQMTGYNFKYLWPESGEFSIRFSSVTGGVTYIWYFLFAVTLFNLKKQSLILYRGLMTATIIAAAFVILGFFTDVSKYLSAFAIVALPLPLVTGIMALRKKLPSSIFFLCGSIFHCSSAYIFVLTMIGVDLGLHRNIFPVAGVGLLLDICLFAGALIYQSKVVRDDLSHSLQNRIVEAEELAQMEREKSASLAKLQDYTLQLAATTHDLTQPLASIKMTLSVVDENESAEAKSRMQTTLRYTEKILHSLLNTTKKEFLELDQSLKLSSLGAELKLRHDNKVEEKGLDLRLFSSDGRVNCSSVVVNRILDNLVSNAFRNTERGGVLVSFRRRSSGVLIEVWDTGSGIDSALLSKISRPYSQLNHSGQDTEGMGLGLYIVKALCANAGYALSIRSRVGRGSCFGFIVPGVVV